MRCITTYLFYFFDILRTYPSNKNTEHFSTGTGVFIFVVSKLSNRQTIFLYMYGIFASRSNMLFLFHTIFKYH